MIQAVLLSRHPLLYKECLYISRCLCVSVFRELAKNTPRGMCEKWGERLHLPKFGPLLYFCTFVLFVLLYFLIWLDSALEGPILHQLVIFFGALFSNFIICIENKLCKVRDKSFISKYLRPTLNFHIVNYYFYIKNTFYYVKSKHWARPLRDLEIIYNFA